MASSRKPPGAEQVLAAARAALAAHPWRGRRLVVGLSGGVDSTTLLHALRALAPEFGYALRALHVHHGLSPNADAWRRFCARLCRDWKIPLASHKVKVLRGKAGPEAAARGARYAVLRRARADAVALAHQLDDQAETVLMNLLRGAGLAGASGMPAAARLGGKLLLRPLLAVPREAIVAYARRHRLDWIEDESNRDAALTRGYLRREVAPVLARRFPRWRESLARAARHFAAADAGAARALREFLAARGLRAPSEAKLAEMLKQLGSSGGRVAIRHDGATLRLYRGKVNLSRAGAPARFAPVRWGGERRLALPELGGALHFRRATGRGIALEPLKDKGLTVRLRGGGERLRPDPRRPRRTLKNLFQEAGVPPWVRERLPLLYRDAELVWVPGIGVDARFRASGRARGIVPEWRPLVS
jgi:tRNA(Ile)-lysidine synthase